MTTVIVACQTIQDELAMAMQEVGCTHPVVWIESGLHLEPGGLKLRIQEELAKLSDVDQVLMAFGICGNCFVGVTPGSFRLIFPRADDCITLMLGSAQRRREISQDGATYFLTKGWLKYEKNIWAEYREAVERLGQGRADRAFKVMLQHYRYLGLIETGAYNMPEFLGQTEVVAQDLKLERQVIPGSLRYIKKLLTGPWDEEFVTVAPGETVLLEHIYGNVGAAKP